MKRIIDTGKQILRYGLILFSVFLLTETAIQAQYFSRNKPSYKTFDFKVLQTPHFEIYHYFKNDSMTDILAQWAEEWYQMHQQSFRDTFFMRNPLIIYDNHADFQQTNTISGLIGVGTGGVTESVKNRVIIPAASTLSQTDHVLGHEMVHAFQFNLLLNADSSIGMSYNNIPLWMIEGMAEYFSIGSVDPNTAMWMRDALINEDFPTLKDLSTDYRYFPYRYGHAFWAMVGKTWGDTVILPLFKEAARFGYDRAFRNILGLNSENLSSMWKSSMETHFSKYLTDSLEDVAGKKLISSDNAGTINISPSISHDGKYIVFFSEKDLFSLDLYLADAESGKIIRKLSSVIQNHEIDDFNFIESAGTWSPAGDRFAFVIFSKGANKLAIYDMEKGKITDEIDIQGVPSFNGPAWSPDGRRILVSGLVDGMVDLYTYDLETGSVDRLTDDFHSNIHPAWSSDGRYIVYSTERINETGNRKKYSFDLVILDVETGQIRILDVFPGADNLNPLFTSDNKAVYFLSNRDGFRNLYKFDLASGKVYNMTRYPTGISGITAFAPAVSISQNTGKVAYTYYYGTDYLIYIASSDDFTAVETDGRDVNFDAGTLPPVNHLAANVVDSTLYNRLNNKFMPADSFQRVPYRPRFQLDDISNVAQTGVTTGRYGTNMAGSVSMMFSDMLGNNQLYAAISLNGEIYDFGAQVAYLNEKKRIKWGSALSHVPYLFGTMSITKDSITYNNEDIVANNIRLDYMRMFQDNISVFAYYPLNQTRRFEAGMATSWYYYRIDRYNNYYSDYGVFLGATKNKLDAPSGFNLQQVDVAYVEDNSYFGMTAPLQGHRARYQIGKYFGEVGFFSVLGDYRNYFFRKPFGLAFRLYHYGRYGNKAENDIMSPLYLGYPWLVRGYDSRSIYNNNVDSESIDFDISHLSGSRMAVGNIELRIPVIGPERLGLIKSRYVGTDFNLFFDGGLAWDSENKPVLQWKYDPAKRTPVFSTGVSVRVNVMGYIILEPYYAFPLQNGGFKNGNFGLNITPGW
ncbi:MAG: PD40 domain-containing protein [Bacteroidales bacterium]|nr:PD40 domain-containing protein [Bacteroidales bacterium]